MRRFALMGLAAASGLLTTGSAVNADFILTTDRTTVGTGPTAKDVIRFFARNDGLNGSGTTLKTLKADLTSIASPLIFNFSDFDGDGEPDANVFGLATAMLATTNPSIYTGSFIRITSNTGNASSSIQDVRPRTNPALVADALGNMSDPGGTGSPTNSPTARYTGINTFGVDIAQTNTGQTATTAIPFAIAVVAKDTTVSVTARLFGNTGGGFNASLTNSTAPIPEPASAGLVAVGGILLAARRRRRATTI